MCILREGSFSASGCPVAAGPFAEKAAFSPPSLFAPSVPSPLFNATVRCALTCLHVSTCVAILCLEVG